MYVLKTDKTKILRDKEAFEYNNVKYPSNYPKDELDFLAHVTEVYRPSIDNATQKITGYTIDEMYTQVWTVENKTQQEQEEYSTLQATEYQRLREADYPKIGDQLDAIMKWAFSETEIGLPDELKSIAAQCMAVKSKYPKPE